MSIGLARDIVALQPYDPQWSKLFEKERDALITACGSDILDIEHVGSTAVPGLIAKPIIDMVASVKSFESIEKVIPILQALGYEYMPTRMFLDRKFFPKGSSQCRTHHLNIVLRDDPNQWRDVLAFRNYLRSHPQACQAYHDLKQDLAAQFTVNRSAYTAAKAQFIQDIIAKTR